jgi:hypothetical protein
MSIDEDSSENDDIVNMMNRNTAFTLIKIYYYIKSIFQILSKIGLINSILQV